MTPCVPEALPYRTVLRMTSLRPAPGYTVIRPRPSESSTPAGIILPETSQTAPVRGEVLAAGAPTPVGGHLTVAPCEPGDEVIYSKYAGVEFEDVLLVAFKDVLAVVA